MNYFDLSSSFTFLYSLYEYLCCRKKVEEECCEGYYDGFDYEKDSTQIYSYENLYCEIKEDDKEEDSTQIYSYENLYCEIKEDDDKEENNKLITPTNTPNNLHSRYQSKSFTFNL
jgi:hypothetical protein